jgi:nitrite reductase (NADH) small subunit
MTGRDVWTAVCALDQLLPERGVAALVEQAQLAVFRCSDDTVYVIDNRDPFTGVQVLSRGIVGTRGDAATVASPLHKQVFDLRTGACLDDPEVSVATYPVRVRDGVIEVATS